MRKGEQKKECKKRNESGTGRWASDGEGGFARVGGGVERKLIVIHSAGSRPVGRRGHGVSEGLASRYNLRRSRRSQGG